MGEVWFTVHKVRMFSVEMNIEVQPKLECARPIWTFKKDLRWWLFSPSDR